MSSHVAVRGAPAEDASFADGADRGGSPQGVHRLDKVSHNGTHHGGTGGTRIFRTVSGLLRSLHLMPGSGQRRSRGRMEGRVVCL